MNPINLYEAYTAVYDEELRDELEVIDEDLSFIDDLSDNELTQIMEEILRDREVSLNECYYAFEEVVLSEARVTTGAGYGRDGVEPRKVRTGSAKVTYSKGEEEQRARVGRKHAIKRLQVATGRAAERIRSGAESAKTKAGGAISALAGGAAEAGRRGKAAAQRVGGKLAAAKERISKFVQAQGKRIGDAKQQAHVGLAKYASNRNLMPGAGLKTRSSRGRSELRGVVASDVAQRAITKPGREVEKAKSGLKGLLRRGAEKVAQRATSFAQRMSEELELVIPYILEDLVQEGYAVNYNEALHILESMSGYEVGELAESYLVEEEFESWVEGLWEEGYDLSDYTWEGLYEAYIDEANKGEKRLNLNPDEIVKRRQTSAFPFLRSGYKGEAETIERRNWQRRGSGRVKGGDPSLGKTVWQGGRAPDGDVDRMRRIEHQRSRGKKRLPESYDAYDDVLNYLLDEGYAETVEDATTIMANMSEEWRDEILDEANRVERELNLSSRAREQARNLNKNADSPIFYKNSLMGRTNDPISNRIHKKLTATRRASHKAGRNLRGDTGESGNVVRSRYQANKDHRDGYPSIRRVDT